MRRAMLGVAVVGTLAAACAPSAPPPATPSITRTLTTPTTPLTYGWVMIHNGDAWGVQIGPKNDGSGTHVAVYAWQNCQTTCVWEFFREYDALAPGSQHTYSVVWNNGWHLSYDGHVLVTLNPGGPTSAVTESNCCEHTTR